MLGAWLQKACWNNSTTLEGSLACHSGGRIDQIDCIKSYKVNKNQGDLIPTLGKGCVMSDSRVFDL